MVCRHSAVHGHLQHLASVLRQTHALPCVLPPLIFPQLRWYICSMNAAAGRAPPAEG